LEKIQPGCTLPRKRQGKRRAKKIELYAYL